MTDWKKEMVRRRFLDVLDVVERAVLVNIEAHGPLNLRLAIPAYEPGSQSSESRKEK